MDAASKRGGLTLLEILVVIFVLGLLMALAIPAIIRGREMSRRATCLNNLHQIGIGVHGYESAFGVFPATRNGLDYSPLVQILPFQGQPALYDHFTVPEALQALHPDRFPTQRPSLTFPGLRCPSDPVAWAGGEVSSYAGNEGDGVIRKGLTSGFFSNGPFPRLENHLSASDFTDGLSHTAAFSEWLVGEGSLQGPNDSPRPAGVGLTREQRLRSVYRVDGDIFGPPISENELIDRCRTLREMKTEPMLQKGSLWFLPGSVASLYNHSMSINDNSCRNFFSSPSGRLLSITGSSLHDGGVNVLMGDGHASFARESIGLPVWRAMATRSGGELP